MMLANILVKNFLAGGPVMWPILIAAIVAVAVIGERAFWWWRESRKRESQKLERLFAAIENGDFRQASDVSKDSSDPIIRMIWHGMNHFHSSLQGALQVSAGVEIQKAGRFHRRQLAERTGDVSIKIDDGNDALVTGERVGNLQRTHG